jgi:hypothetical protein
MTKEPQTTNNQDSRRSPFAFLNYGFLGWLEKVGVFFSFVKFSRLEGEKQSQKYVCKQTNNAHDSSSR